MYQANINNSSYQLLLENTVQLNGVEKKVLFTPISAESFRMKVQDKEYVADLVRIDREQKTVVLRIEGKKYSVQVKEPLDLFLDKIGIQLPVAKKMNNLIAPMPGMILKLMVKEGVVVKKGDALLILEAMKMENVFKASEDAVIKSMNISEKQAVEKGTELITFE
jgi:acetyl/propionyl-CoA carboxylase alpha subunit